MDRGPHRPNPHGAQEYSFTEFLAEVEAGRISEIVVSGNEVHGKMKDDNSPLRTVIPANYPDIYKLLQDKGVDVEIEKVRLGQLGFAFNQRNTFLCCCWLSGSS